MITRQKSVLERLLPTPLENELNSFCSKIKVTNIKTLIIVKKITVFRIYIFPFYKIFTIVNKIFHRHY